jgi:DNA-binding FrmR family transcriptional regulator
MGVGVMQESLMDEKIQADAIHRLKSVAGHINGIIRMLEEDRYCIDVIKQIQATQTALSRVSESILDAHLRTCVTTAIQDDDQNERERVLAEVIEVFRQTNK